MTTNEWYVKYNFVAPLIDEEIQNIATITGCDCINTLQIYSNAHEIRNKIANSLSLQPNQRFFKENQEKYLVSYVGKPVAAVLMWSTPWIFLKNIRRPQNNTRSRALLPTTSLGQSQRGNPPILFVTRLWPIFPFRGRFW